MTTAETNAEAMAAAADEAARLAALASYAVLDTAAEAAYDDIVRVAAQVCATPIALVTLVDRDRQWFKARLGTDLTGSSRQTAFCDHAIRQDGLMVVADAAQDARFSANPLVTEAPHVRFYAGAPIVAPGGARLGTVCVLDSAPRAGLSGEQAETLQALARLVTTQLQLRAAIAERDALLRDKETLVHEVHHRVANSLHLVHAILKLQSRGNTEAAPREQLDKASERVMAIAVAHRHLYQSGSVQTADSAAYLAALLADLRGAGGAERAAPPVELDAVSLALPADRLTSLGIVVTELVTNARAHGGGRVRVVLRAVADELELTVEDEGAGFPADFDPAAGRGVGMRLAGTLSPRGRPLRIDRNVAFGRIVARLPAA